MPGGTHDYASRRSGGSKRTPQTAYQKEGSRQFFGLPKQPAYVDSPSEAVALEKATNETVSGSQVAKLQQQEKTKFEQQTRLYLQNNAVVVDKDR